MNDAIQPTYDDLLTTIEALEARIQDIENGLSSQIYDALDEFTYRNMFIDKVEDVARAYVENYDFSDIVAGCVSEIDFTITAR